MQALGAPVFLKVSLLLYFPLLFPFSHLRFSCPVLPLGPTAASCQALSAPFFPMGCRSTVLLRDSGCVFPQSLRPVPLEQGTKGFYSDSDLPAGLTYHSFSGSQYEVHEPQKPT